MEELNNLTLDFSFDESLTDSLAWINGEEKIPMNIVSAKQSLTN